MNGLTDCLGCLAIEANPVTLHDGRTVCSSCECWRMECEARTVLAMPLEQRRKYLEGDPEGKDDNERLGVLQRRGQAATDALKAAITVLWEARK